MRKLKLFLILTLFLSMGLSAIIILNDSETAYNGNGTDGQKSGNNQVKTLVIVGAVQFLESHSYFQVFLKRVELAQLSGVNYDEVDGVLDATILSLERAKDTYDDLKNLAGNISYDLAVIEKLKVFDYDGFREENNDFNPLVFQEVNGFLSSGDVTGSYNKMFTDITNILERLRSLKQGIYDNTFPQISIIWELNQKYSNALFFGQYVAMIFKVIQNR